MKAKRSELIAALDGRFDEHHAELARMLLDQIDALSAQIDTLSARIEELIAELPDDARAIEHLTVAMGPAPAQAAMPIPISVPAPAAPTRYASIPPSRSNARLRPNTR